MSPTSDPHRRLRRSGALAGLALAALALAPAAALASPAGELDPSFDRDGRRLLSGMQSANRVLAQPDGKTVVVGDSYGAFHVSRLNGDGSRDRGFGKDGVALIDFGGDDRGLAAALQPDGKIVVAGDSLTQTGPRPAIARLTSEGSLDATFDPGGADGDGKKILIGAPIGSDLKSVLVQPDGKLVLAGRGYSNGYSDMAVMRLNRNGSPDGTTFARGSFGSQVDAEAAALLPDGRIVVAGTRYSSNGERYEIALTRFNADDGSLDATLGGTGNVTLASDQNETVRAVLAQPDGKLVVAGGTTGNDPEMIVARVSADGSLDRSFAGDGRAGAGFDGISLAGALALAPDGKILVAGAVVPPYDFAVARFDSSGALDASFGSAGRTTVGFGLASAASAIALQGDGRAIVAGMAFGGVAVPVARLLADPTPQPGGGGQGGPVGDGGGPGPGGGSGSGGGAPVDRTAPVIGRISLSPKAFAASSRSTAQSAAARGTTIRYTLSEAATVIARIERAGAGRRAGTLRRAGRAGSNRLAFSGRVGRKALRPGAYRLVLTATDAAGNRSAARSARFRILR